MQVIKFSAHFCAEFTFQCKACVFVQGQMVRRDLIVFAIYGLPSVRRWLVCGRSRHGCLLYHLTLHGFTTHLKDGFNVSQPAKMLVLRKRRLFWKENGGTFEDIDGWTVCTASLPDGTRCPEFAGSYSVTWDTEKSVQRLNMCLWELLTAQNLVTVVNLMLFCLFYAYFQYFLLLSTYSRINCNIVSRIKKSEFHYSIV